MRASSGLSARHLITAKGWYFSLFFQGKERRGTVVNGGDGGSEGLNRGSPLREEKESCLLEATAVLRRITRPFCAFVPPGRRRPGRA